MIPKSDSALFIGTRRRSVRKDDFQFNLLSNLRHEVIFNLPLDFVSILN